MSSTAFVVIGSNCFTGSHIVDALLEDPDQRVIGISRSPEYEAPYLPYKRRGQANFEFRQIHLTRQFEDLANLIETAFKYWPRMSGS